MHELMVQLSDRAPLLRAVRGDNPVEPVVRESVCYMLDVGIGAPNLPPGKYAVNMTKVIVQDGRLLVSLRIVEAP